MVKQSGEKGSISISNDVFNNLVGDAASSCFGVKGMAGREETGFWQLLRRESMSKGVEVHFYDSENAISVELHIVVDHGVNLSALCDSIMSEVSYKVAAATGVTVRQVDVYIDSMNMD